MIINRTSVRASLCFGILSLAIACAQSTKAPAPSFRAMGQAAASEDQPSDETIGTNVRRQLDLIGPAESVSIVVVVEDGVVTLRGTAPNQNAVWKAEAAARSVKGVKKVVSQVLFTATVR